MKPSQKVFILAIMIIIFLTSTALAISNYQVDWWTVDSGGGFSQSTGGEFTLHGTIGQPDADLPISGGGYTVIGGFWGGPAEAPTTFNYVYMPLITK